MAFRKQRLDGERRALPRLAEASSDGPRQAGRALRPPVPEWTGPVAVRVTTIALSATLLLLVLELGFKAIPQGSGDLVEGLLSNLVLVGSTGLCAARALLRSRERVTWTLFASALASWTFGDVYYALAFFGLDEVPFPSPADAGYFGLYVFAYAGLASLLRARLPHLDSLVRLDGVIAGLGFGALGMAFIVPAVIREADGLSVGAAINLAYLLADLSLLALVVGTFAVTGRYSLRTWSGVAAGIALVAVADALFLYLEARTSYVNGGLVDALWPAGALLIGIAAWRPPMSISRPSHHGSRRIAVPLSFGTLALALVMYAGFGTVNPLALALAGVALLGVLVRLALTFRDHSRLLDMSRDEATTDPLTGLGNRRRLMADLGSRAAEGSASAPAALGLFDLDGFKLYNDTFGHPAGDAVLARLGRRLSEVIGYRGAAYRLGGDEFCVLARGEGEEAVSVLEEAASALQERGESFTLGCSHGAVLLPVETSDPTEALRIADHRMYRQKYARQGSVTRQTTAVVMRLFTESRPGLHTHLTSVGRDAEAVARRFGLPDDQVEHVRAAGELHDVGKMGIPAEILDKPGELDAEERAFVQRHPIIGERIVAAAPALMPVAALIRSSHERFDGRGYPDGLRGHEILLGARIVAACDAFDAMVSNRPYAAALDHEAAVAELVRGAGSQFDPRVVDVLLVVLADRRAHAPHGTHDAAAALAARDAP
jgi:two-component system, cell cycle response regulator